jgi:prepilin-type N-terminal cleavage/methylation domain-containing protein/prepilin-type processing-associated H-X9-DG protein
MKAATKKSAFTLTELLVVIGIVAVLAAVLLPAHAKSRDKAQALTCISNNKQLVLGVIMYANDSQGLLPPNGDEDGDGTYWIIGDMQSPQDSRDRSYLTNSAGNKLAPYTGSNMDIYRCPADRTGYSFPGVVYLRSRSYSMSYAVGTVGGANSSVIPNGAPSVGLWLDGPPSTVSPASDHWNTYGQIATIAAPGPANVWIFADEDEYSIRIGSFGVCMNSPSVNGQPTSWVNWPSTRHGYSASFSFLDGHAEVHQWLDSRTRNINHVKGPNSWGTAANIVAQPNNPDIEWLQSHTTAHK